MHRELSVWTADELGVFLRGVEEDRCSAMWRVFAMTGMRRGEVAGLKWSDIDLNAQTLTVNRSRLRVDGEIREKEPKTEPGRRTIELDQATVDALIGWDAQVTAEQIEGGNENPDGWVWIHDDDGHAIDPTGITRSFNRLVEGFKNVPRIRLHDLRHTHATLLLKAGVPVHVVSKRLGHEKESFTLEVYGHVYTGQQREGVELVATAVDA